jgi:ADP-ribose pyrophosphatase YjhB (NUDIX family)
LGQAVRREVREETEVELDNIRRISFDEDYEPNKHGEITHYVFLVHEGECKSGKLKADDDINKLRWFSATELKSISLTRPSVKLFKELKLI